MASNSCLPSKINVKSKSKMEGDKTEMDGCMLPWSCPLNPNNQQAHPLIYYCHVDYIHPLVIGTFSQFLYNYIIIAQGCLLLFTNVLCQCYVTTVSIPTLFVVSIGCLVTYIHKEPSMVWHEAIFHIETEVNKALHNVANLATQICNCATFQVLILASV